MSSNPTAPTIRIKHLGQSARVGFLLSWTIAAIAPHIAPNRRCGCSRACICETDSAHKPIQDSEPPRHPRPRLADESPLFCGHALEGTPPAHPLRLAAVAVGHASLPAQSRPGLAHALGYTGIVGSPLPAPHIEPGTIREFGSCLTSTRDCVAEPSSRLRNAALHGRRPTMKFAPVPDRRGEPQRRLRMAPLRAPAAPWVRGRSSEYRNS